MDVRRALELLASAVHLLERRVSALEHETPHARPVAQTNALLESERTMLINALANAGGIQSHAALALGISARVMQYKVNKYGLHAYCRLSKSR